MKPITNVPPYNSVLTLVKAKVKKIKTMWYSKYKCICGNIIITRDTSVRNGHTKSCGCLMVTTKMPSDSRLTLSNKNVSKNKRGDNESKYKCKCGNFIVAVDTLVRSGNIKSCGCLQRDSARNLFTTHGLSNTRIFKVHKGMKDRCFNPSSPVYKYYGGRGITMCNKWKNDFMSFYNWAMKNGYDKKLTIDRKDNNGNYKPSNCRWVTQTEQMRNTSKSVGIRKAKKIKSCLRNGKLSVTEIASLLSTTYSVVDSIKRGKTYSDIKI